jgi:hypothetical protein
VHDLLELDATQGWQIYSGGGYRYGPSIVRHPDGSLDLWTCSPGSGGAWDFIRHRHSTDGGQSWTPDDVALQPSPGTKDAFSCCDPGAVYFNGHYYLGYTSTENPKGTANEVYLARGPSPSGPFEKWDGAGWGGAPQPIVHYQGSPDTYGLGEPSILVARGKVWVYYTNADVPGSFTDLATADDPNDENWPAALAPKGHVVTHAGAQDSIDVKFVEAFDRFVAVGTYDRFGPNATVRAYQSSDGVAFEPTPYKGARVQDGAHNLGISGNEAGHIEAGAPVFVAYAYAPQGSSWGDWPTFLDLVTLSHAPLGTTVGGGVSSIVGGKDWSWSGPKAWDGDLGSVWSSDSHGGEANADEWVFVDVGASRPIAGVDVVPRPGTDGFPVDFVIEASDDAASWAAVPTTSRAGFPNPNGQKVSIPFPPGTSARFVRLHATKLGADGFGNHYLQLAELVPTY